jgi:hypothetical protein
MEEWRDATSRAGALERTADSDSIRRSRRFPSASLPTWVLSEGYHFAPIRQRRTMRPLSRRAFVALAAALAMPRWARGQSAERIRRLGWLGAIDGLKEPQAVAFVQRLRELGFADGSNLQITYRHAGGRLERLPSLATELRKLNPDLLFGSGAGSQPFRVEAGGWRRAHRVRRSRFRSSCYRLRCESGAPWRPHHRCYRSSIRLARQAHGAAERAVARDAKSGGAGKRPNHGPVRRRRGSRQTASSR